MTVSVRPWDQIAADLRGHVEPGFSQVRAAFYREAAVAGDALATENTELRESANRWAYKMTLLVGWVKAHCTPEQTAEARMVTQIAESDGVLAELDRLAAVVAAVHTALDQYDADRYHVGGMAAAAPACVAAIAKAVGR